MQDRFIDAAEAASEAFRRAGVRHTLVGGLAVGIRGYVRNTSDVDFLVGEEAFEHQGPLVSPRAGLPIKHNDVIIDWVSMNENERVFFEPFIEVPAPGQVPVAPAHVLLVMKAIAGRQKDLGDMVELIKAGADVEQARKLASSVRPGVLARLDEMVVKASEES